MTIEEVNRIIEQLKNLIKCQNDKGELRLKTIGFHGVSMGSYKEWDVVFKSMREQPEFTNFVDVRCPRCKHKLVRLWYSAPKYYWQNLMGNGGLLRICPNCGLQQRYKVVMIN